VSDGGPSNGSSLPAKQNTKFRLSPPRLPTSYLPTPTPRAGKASPRSCATPGTDHPRRALRNGGEWPTTESARIRTVDRRSPLHRIRPEGARRRSEATPESGHPEWTAAHELRIRWTHDKSLPPPATHPESFMTKHKQFQQRCSRRATSGSKASLRAYATLFSDRPGATPAARHRNGGRKHSRSRSDEMHTDSAPGPAGRLRRRTRRWHRVPIPARPPGAFFQQSDFPGCRPPRELTKRRLEWRRSARRRRDAIVQEVRTSDVAGVHQPQNRPNGAVALTRGRPRLCQMPSGASTRVDDER
jgi:hypothetical protein